MRLHHHTIFRLSLVLNAGLLFTYGVWYLREPAVEERPAAGPVAVAPLPPLPLAPERPAPAATTVNEEDVAATTARPPPPAAAPTVAALPANATRSPVRTTCALHGLQHCQDVDPRPHTDMRGTRFWVMYNFVVGDRRFGCGESVTYTTHGDFTFVDNLAPLVRRWRGPVSFGLYAPGEDFEVSVESVAYLRQCDPLVAELVTFHVIYDVDKVPLNVTGAARLLQRHHDCEQPPWLGVDSFRKAKRLTYPVNVARNVARETVMTHFVLASDVELYPSQGLVVDFLAMVRRNPAVLCQPRPRVFVLSIFEVNETMLPPSHKDQLTAMLKNGSAIPFHKRMCASCHTIPKAKEWTFSRETTQLDVFHVGKRYAPYEKWEPIYISTNEAPTYDERLTWEGKMDKMGQGYAMCLLDYDFMILNNAFLVHKPGIKTFKPDKWRDTLVAKQRRFVINAARVELDRIYGQRKKCVLK